MNDIWPQVAAHCTLVGASRLSRCSRFLRECIAQSQLKRLYINSLPGQCRCVALTIELENCCGYVPSTCRADRIPILLEAGADPRRWNQRCLLLACHRKRHDIIRLLLEAGCSVDRAIGVFGLLYGDEMECLKPYRHGKTRYLNYEDCVVDEQPCEGACSIKLDATRTVIQHL